MTTETIGQRLARLRHAAGLSQRELSVPGVSYAYISRIEANTRTPSVKALRKIAPRLGVTVEYLETGTDRTPHEQRLRNIIRLKQERIDRLTREKAELQAKLDEVERLDSVLLQAARAVSAKDRVAVA